MSSTAFRVVCIALLVSTSLLQACGQKGPLYRPDEKAQTVGEEGTSRNKKKAPLPAPQSQKVPTDPSAPANPRVDDPGPAPTPPQGNAA